MQLPDLLSALRMNRDFMRDVVAWERLRARPAQTAPLANPLSERLLDALRERGIEQFFTHQAAAIDAAQRGENVVIATATASGKSLCYTVPVLQRLMERPKARALYLFPTKALAHDQWAETAALINAANLPVEVHNYDGDTPQSQRRKVRAADGILITNPDMLHAGMLPYHPTWRNLLRGLEFVVLDEIHAYTGVFGSHVANVVRRLRRVGAPFTLVDEAQNGAPTGEKQFILYNPPIIDEELGLRGSVVLAAKDTAVTFLAENIQTIVFARARQTVELLLTYIQDELAYMGKGETAVTGYRGGYLPLERRDIEIGLRTGDLRGVVATNALELGIDIGQLDAAVITGYPGSIASVWQQAGRAGRRAAQSAAVLIASNNALDQYICNNPRYLFGRSPEHALTNPDNLRILLRHLGCAAFELPFRKGETFGGYAPVDPLLEALQEAGDLHETRGQYHWLGEGPPSHTVSLRTSGDDTVLIHDVAADNAIIGEIDLESVPLLLYEGAIYMHQARTYLVDELDWDGRIAHVRPVDVDYYTRASVGSVIRALRPEEEFLLQRDEGTKETKGEKKGSVDLLRAWGDVTVVTQATGYRKVKRYTHETLGFGLIELPEMTLETSGYWLIFGEALTERLYNMGILLRPNEYGPNWQQQRKLALARDGNRCRMCGAGEGVLHVHHIRPFREFNYIPGQNDHYKIANEVDNLLTLCPSCHRQAEAGQQTRSALGGLGYVLRNLAPLFLMCDPGDILVSVESQSPLTKAPTLVIYERIAAGVGFSQRLYELHDELLQSALELVSTCRCRDGCPACVGPPGDIGPDTKDVTRQLLRILVRKIS